jgi:hypothetical protein
MCIDGKCSKMACYGKYFKIRGSNSAWRKLRNMDLYDFYSSENVVTMVMQKDEMGAPCDKHGGGEKCVQGSGGKTFRKEIA